MINSEITKLEKQMDAGTEIEKAYLNDYLENRLVPDEYLGYCKAWDETHDKWNTLCHTQANTKQI
jgi:predicted Ser/Thr protein kinase